MKKTKKCTARDDTSPSSAAALRDGEKPSLLSAIVGVTVVLEEATPEDREQRQAHSPRASGERRQRRNHSRRVSGDEKEGSNTGTMTWRRAYPTALPTAGKTRAKSTAGEKSIEDLEEDGKRLKV